MTVLLATYSYYPYSFGGTEVYVSGLAGSLISKGHQVTIICWCPDAAFETYGVFFEDEQIQTTKYTWEGVLVIGIQYKQTTSTGIYFKGNHQNTRSWVAFFTKLQQCEWNIVHYHAYTAAINLDIFHGIKQLYSAAKLLFSYHLPVSCVKGTLMYGNQLEDCLVQPSARICTSCVVAGRLQQPVWLVQPFVSILPSFKSRKLPFALRSKWLVAGAIGSFQQLVKACDRWFVFSRQINDILLLNGVQPDKITPLHHGVDRIFLDIPVTVERTGGTTIFLYAGRFEKLKGFHTLLKSWASIKESYQRKLVIAGGFQGMEDAEIKSCMALVATRTDIEWAGQKTPDEIVHLMDRAHCTIIPSEWVEIGPLVFHEAISRGSDVLCADIGGCRALAALYQLKSACFRAGDVNSLTEAILNFTFSNHTYHVAERKDNYEVVATSYGQLLAVP